MNASEVFLLGLQLTTKLEDRFRRPKWRIRRLVPLSELEDAVRRHEARGHELAALTDDAGDSGQGTLYCSLPHSTKMYEVFTTPQNAASHKA